jgi:hypothetical protein
VYQKLRFGVLEHLSELQQIGLQKEQLPPEAFTLLLIFDFLENIRSLNL